MYYFHVTANIMSLGGLALAIGVLVDAGIVMVENGYRHLSERQQELALSQLPGTPRPGTATEPPDRPAPARIDRRERRRILLDAAKQVGPAIFFSLVIIVVSFLPVFLLEAQEGRMFRPLAWTKTLAVGFSSLLAITLVPVLMLMFIRGRLKPESANPISRITQAIYLPILRWCLHHRVITVLANVLFLALTIPLAFRIGSQFMPPFYEGSALYMPTAYPGISITQASTLLQEQDRIIRSFPEVESVFGTVGRSDTATDNAPLSMYDTTIMLKPRDKWRPGMTVTKLVQEMDQKLQFPGITNTWTQPIQNRLDMELTGIKTPVGMKIQGPNLVGIQRLGEQVEKILAGLGGVRSIFAERVSQGFYVNVQVDRPVAARYGLTVMDVQRAVASGIGGQDIAENIEGRERYPINVRYDRDFRDDLDALGRVLITTPTGAQIPINEVAKVSFSRGAAMIRDEDAALTGYVFVDLTTNDYGGFVQTADAALRQQLKLPAGYSYQWSGEYEFELRAKQRLKLILPDRLLRHFSAALYGVPLCRGGHGAHFPHVLRHDRGPHSAMAIGLRIQCGGLGGLHRVVRNRHRDRRGNGRLSARSAQQAARSGHSSRPRGHRSCHHRRRRPAPAPQADDGLRGAGEPRAHPLGDRGRLRRDEAHRHAHRRGHGDFHHSCPDSGAGVLRHHEGACAPAWNTATLRGGRTEDSA